MKRIIIILIILAAVLALPSYAEDVNLMRTASLYQCTGYINGDEQAAFLFDGDNDTKWCSVPDSTDYTDFDFRDRYKEGYLHILAVDFGKEVYFDRYRLYLASSGGRDYGQTGYDAESWMIQTSSDGESWADVSRVDYNYENVVTVDIGTRAARYLRILVDRPESGGGSTVRLYELEVYECEKGELASGLVTTEGSNAEAEKTEQKAPLTSAPEPDETEADGEDGNEIAYAPSEAAAYEGYTLGADGTAALVALFIIAAAITAISAKSAVKNKIYD